MIKTERLELIIEILTSQMNHWILFPVVMTVQGLAMQLAGNPIEKDPDLLLWAACGLIPIACFLFRNHVERFWLFVLCHGGIIAGSLFLALRGGVILCIVCAVVYTIYSFTLRLRENDAVYSDTIHPLTALGISAAANFLFHRQENMPDWDRYYLFLLIGVLACYLIIYYLKHYLSFLRVNRSSAGYLPAKEILHSGIGFVLPYTLFGVLILTLSLNVEWLESVLQVIKGIVKPLLRFLIGLIPNDGGEEDLIPDGNTGYTPETEMLNLPPAKTFWLWDVLESLAIILFFAGCVYVLIKALKRLVRFLRERFGTKANSLNIAADEAAVYDIREKCSIEKKNPDSRNAGLFRRFTPVERIRRFYKKRVLAGGIKTEDRAALNYMTARECGHLLSLPDMARLYEQARYSDREITAEDVKRMKQSTMR